MSEFWKTTAWFGGRTGACRAGAAFLLGLTTAGCGAPGGGANRTSSALAAATSGVGATSDLSSAPELGGLMAGLTPPRVPDGVEGFRCDSTPTITTSNVCGHDFPSTIMLDWTDCVARPHGRMDHDDDAVNAGGGGAAGATVAGAAPGPASPDQGTSSGTVNIANTITMTPASSCDATATTAFGRTATTDVITTEADGTSTELIATVTSTSTRDPAAAKFTQDKTVDIARVDRDASGATTRTTHLGGQLTEAYDGSGTSPLRTIDGTLNRDRGDGTTSTFALTAVVLPTRSECRWPLSGTITDSVSDGTTHMLSFGPNCGQGTLDGTVVTLPKHGIHLSGREDGGRGEKAGRDQTGEGGSEAGESHGSSGQSPSGQGGATGAGGAPA